VPALPDLGGDSLLPPGTDDTGPLVPIAD